MKKEILEEIIVVANTLDSSGFIKEANVLDKVAKRIVISQSNSPVQNPNVKNPNVKNPNVQNPNAPLNTKELNSKLFQIMDKAGWVGMSGNIVPFMSVDSLQNFWFDAVQPKFNIKDPRVAQWLTSKYLEYKKSILKSEKEETDAYNRETFFGLFPRKR